MLRYCLVVLLGIWTAETASAGSWAEALFSEQAKDFGSVARGSVLTHAFRVRNTAGQPVHIVGTRVSCGCTRAHVLQQDLAPGESTSVVAEMDTDRFHGDKMVLVFVQFDQPAWDEVVLRVQANSREDVTISPDSLSFGRLAQGGASGKVLISFLDGGDWQVLHPTCDSAYVESTLEVVPLMTGGKVYQLTARLRNDLPPGKWITEVWLHTTHPFIPRIRVPVTVEIEPLLRVSPANVRLSVVEAGGLGRGKVLIQGAKPFEITTVKGTDGIWSIHDDTPGKATLHVLSVSVLGAHPGSLTHSFRVVTDLASDSAVEFQAQAVVRP
jgi:hypothetical protein